MRVLVTGAGGRVGSRFVPRLVAWGEEVRALVRREEQVEPLRSAGAEVVVGDLRREEDRRRAVAGVEAVIHLAASFGFHDPSEPAEVNQVATPALARAAAREGVARLVFTNTGLAYGPGRGRPAHEDDDLRALPEWGAYAATKAAGEGVLRGVAAEEGLDLRVLRLAFVYGDGDPHLAQSLRWARDWPAHRRLHMVHHADVAQALVRALRTAAPEGRAYNVADDAPVTALELHRLNAAQPDPDRADEPLGDHWEGILDTERIRRELGFRPVYPTVYAAREAGAL